MADNIEYKLIRAFDPTKIKVPIKDKFAKLTLSSNKKKPESRTPVDLKAQQGNRKNVSRNLMDSLCATTEDSFELANTAKSYENPLLRSDSSSIANDDFDWQQMEKLVNSTLSIEPAQVPIAHVLDNERPPTQLDQTEHMEPLQVSADDFSQQVDALSQQVSHLSVNTKNNQPHCEVTINITTSDDDSTETDDSVACITITDSSVSENKDTTKGEEPGVSEMALTQITDDDNAAFQQLQPTALSNDKKKRIEAFLRDVSFERQEMARRGEKPADLSIHKQLASADTESMSRASVEFHVEANDVAPLPATPSPRQWTAAEVNDTSKRLADNDTEINTITSDDNLSDIEAPQDSPSHIAGESSMHESVTIPETSSEGETLNESSQSLAHAQPTRSSSSCDSAPVQLSNINISAKIKIKIQISGMKSSTSDSGTSSSDDMSSNPDDVTPSKETRSLPNSEENVDLVRSNQCQQEAANEPAHTPINKPRTPDGASDPDDENFLTNAEKLLTQLYGESWQTPDVMRTLQRTSNSAERKSRTNGDQVQPKANSTKPANNRKRTPKKPARKDARTFPKPAPAVADSFLADFSVFRSNIVNSKMDSTHLDGKSRKKTGTKSITASEPRQRLNYRERRNFATPRTELKRRVVPPARPERWRQLVDTDSEADDNTDAGLASDDDEIDATAMMSDVDDDSSSSADVDTNDESFVKKKHSARNRRSQLIYMDLSKDEASELAPDSAGSPPANHDAEFQNRLMDILRTCRREEKPKLAATPTSDTKTKRKLFTPNIGYEDDAAAEKLINKVREVGDELLEDLENVYLPGTPVHKRLQQLKKQLSGDSPSSGSTPIFKLPNVDKTPTKKTPKAKPMSAVTKSVTSPRSSVRLYEQFERTIETPSSHSYSFLKSLNECVPKAFCHPAALIFRENYRTKKEELGHKLYALYNRQLFSNALDVPLTWNKKLTNTAGRCLNKKRLGSRLSSVELSEKVLTSAERLRCTLIHELCHAAAWVFNGEGGHGATWKSWAARANRTFPDLPPISVCHQYEIEYKYTYQCTLCAAKSHAHSKSKKVEHIRCSYCHGAIRVFLNKKDKSGNIVATPVKEATGFAKFVKDHYKKYKRPDLKHADVMKLLSNEFANMKVIGAD